MIVTINECVHCGIEYRYQASGSMPGDYNDHEYCEECKEVLVKALKTIPKKFGYKFVKTNEVSIETLLRWEKEKTEEHRMRMESGENIFPLMRQIFPSLYDSGTGEHSRSGKISGREEFVGKTYSYFYWPSKINEANVNVEKRVNLLTGEELSYRIKK